MSRGQLRQPKLSYLDGLEDGYMFEDGFRSLLARRTFPLLLRALWFNAPLRQVVESAYLQGMSDAINTLKDQQEGKP